MPLSCRERASSSVRSPTATHRHHAAAKSWLISSCAAWSPIRLCSMRSRPAPSRRRRKPARDGPSGGRVFRRGVRWCNGARDPLHPFGPTPIGCTQLFRGEALLPCEDALGQCNAHAQRCPVVLEPGHHAGNARKSSVEQAHAQPLPGARIVEAKVAFPHIVPYHCQTLNPLVTVQSLSFSRFLPKIGIQECNNPVNTRSVLTSAARPGSQGAGWSRVPRSGRGADGSLDGGSVCR